MASFSVNVTACNTTKINDPARENYEVFARIVNGYLTAICVVLGTIGNLHGIKSVQNANLDKNRGVVLAVSMMALAIWDTILLWCAFFYYGAKKLPGTDNSDALTVIQPWFHAFSQIANTASIWCVVAITTQRYMATRDPFRSNRATKVVHSFRSDRRVSAHSFMLCATYRRLFRLPVLLSILAILVNFPAFFELGTKVCYHVAEKRLSLKLQVMPFRTDPAYLFWYKLLFRMLVTSIGPNLFILFFTLLTIYLLKGSNKSRRQLFHMSDSLLDRYSSRETMQTLISIMLVTKFLLFRSLSFAIDIMEIAGVFTHRGAYSYYLYSLVDMSNFFILLNSATNSLIFLKGSNWLNAKIVERKTMKRKKTICDTGQLFGERLALLTSSWQQAQRMTNGQLGLRVLYSMLRKHPALFDIFRTASFYEFAQLNEEKEKVTQNGARRSFDLITNPNRKEMDAPGMRYQEVADRITKFITEILEMMSTGQSEQFIMQRIRRVGAVHFDKGIHFSSSVWREFKASLLTIMAECEYRSKEVRRSFICMKFG
ncbi:unnamed protein product, partial [Mesorhabditis belari]|uniref:G-protein coupled receptors family 1 profile domain-containing protein n=1 Tax=Mesorhabditis belari TaxID=2138241 RepID=A0AAF3FA33_9BILA